MKNFIDKSVKKFGEKFGYENIKVVVVEESIEESMDNSI